MADKLFLNGEEVDLLSSTTIAQTFQVNDLAEIKDRQGNFTNQFKLPKTDRNCRILGYANVVGSQSDIPYSNVEAKIISDGLETISAAIAVVQSSGDYFEVNIIGGNSKFFSSIDGLKLSDLDLSAYDLVWNGANLISRYNTKNSPGFVIVDDGDLPTGTREVELTKQFPVMFFKHLVEEIHAAQGYSISGDIFEDEFFTSAYLPFTNEAPATGLADRALAYSKAIPGSLQGIPNNDKIPFDVEVQDDNNNYNPGTYTYTAPLDGKYKLNGRLLLLRYGAAPTKVDVKKNGVSLGNVYASYSVGTLNVLELPAIEITMVAGDQINLWLNLDSGTSADIYVNGADFGRDDLISEIEFTLSEELAFGGNWNQAINLPNISQKDFLKAVMNMFCLTCLIDPVTKVARYVNFDEIALNRGNAKDWSAYLAQDKNDVPIYFHPNSYAQKNYMRYKADDSVEEEYGDGFLSVPDATLPAIKESVTLPFAATHHNEKLIGLQVAIINREESTVPRVLFADGYDTGNDQGGDVIFKENGVTLSTDPGLVRGNFAPDTFLDYGLFATETRKGGFDNNLIEIYYSGYAEMLTRYKRITPIMYLPAHEIASLDHFRPVYLSQFSEYFYINKIENYQSGKPCRVELIRV